MQLRNSYVIPSVAEESEMPDIDSISGFLDSSATLGMTSSCPLILNSVEGWAAGLPLAGIIVTIVP